MKQVSLSPLARSDLRAIWTYSRDRWGVQQADTYIRSINAFMAELLERRAQARSCDDIREGYYKATFKSHTIFFQWEEGGIDVKRVLHQSMDFDRHL